MKVGERVVSWLTIDALLVNKAREHGAKPFIEVDGQVLSYSALEERSRSLGRALMARGIGRGDRVATLLFNRLEQLLLLFAVTRIGAVWTPFNAGLLGQDLAYTLRNSGARLLVVEAETAVRLEALDAAARADLEIYAIGGGAGLRDFAELLESGDDGELPATEPGDAAVILYTGGTTGLPKGVVLPQLSFVLAGIRYGETFATHAGERHYTTLPLFHAAAIQFAVFGPLVNDMTAVIDRRFSASAYWQRVRATGASVIDPIGSMVGLLCAQPERPEDRSHAVRVAVGIVGQVPAEVPQRFCQRFGVPMVSIYGLTEAGGAMITSNRLGAQKEGSNGRTHGWAELRIADENDVALPAGEIGQILLRPTYPHMFMLGYHGDPAKTLETFRNLWLHTGDLGRVDADGDLTFAGRQAHWIRRRGENISAYEIETILAAMPGIAEVVVVGVLSEFGEDDVKAFIIPEAGATLDPHAVIAFASERMAAFKVPRFIEMVDDFPRSVTKREIERAVLKRMPHDRAFDRERVLGRTSSQAAR